MSDVILNVDNIAMDIMDELDKALAKFPAYPNDPLHAIAILGEEFGELTKAVLQHTYEPHKATINDIRAEAIQTAAMAFRFIASIDNFEFDKSEQHGQRTSYAKVLIEKQAGIRSTQISG